MDDTQQSRASDAGATRKRRSSILKNQRAARTPFSELEFNVATPTDTVKSRRVSFSRRTGVAEFVTNEATTTWKNFYEEHNKSLENSGNDSGANATRQPIGHLGKRIFDQQFEEVEAVDFLTSLDNLAARDINTTMNVNFSNQIALLDCSDDKKLTAPHNNFELSAFTDHHSKIFVDDLAIPVVGEMSGRIDVNFSAVQSLDVKDDLDEIQKDLQRRSNAVEPAFRDARDFSEYIEVELETIQTAQRIEESDMSITETIPSPKVSKTFSPPGKKCSLNMVSDKENNCLVDLKANTVIYDDNADMSITTALENKVEVEKERTIIFDNTADLSMTKPKTAKILCVQSELINKSSNSVCNMTSTKAEDAAEKRKTIIFEDNLGDLSMTRPIPAKLMSIHNESEENPHINVVNDASDKRKTIIFEDDLVELSITKPIPAKFLLSHNESEEKPLINDAPNKRKTILFEDDLGDLSMTKPIAAKLLSIHSQSEEKPLINDAPNKRKTIVFEDGLGDLSMTKPIPAKLLSIHNQSEEKPQVNDDSNKRKTILFEDGLGELSLTKPIPANLLSINNESKEKPHINDASNKRKTIIFEDGLGELSMTKPVPANLLSINNESKEKPHINDASNKRKTIIFEDDLGELSMTKPIPANLLSINNESKEKPHINDASNKRKTILFEDDLGELSMTRPISAKLLSIHGENEEKTDSNNLSIKSSVQSVKDVEEKCRTLLFEDNADNLSITKPIPANFLSIHSEIIEKSFTNVNANKSIEIMKCSIEKRRTVLLNDELQDLSLTKPVSSKFLPVHNDGSKLEDDIRKYHNQTVENNTEKRKTILYDERDLSLTKPISAKLLSTVHSEIISKANTNNNFDNDKAGILGQNECNDNDAKLTDTSIPETLNPSKENITEKRKTILFDDGDLPMTKPVPTELLSILSKSINKTNVTDNFDNLKSSVLEYKHNESKLLTVHDDVKNLTDMSISEDEPNENRKRIMFDEGVHIKNSVTNDELNKTSLHKTQTIVNDNNENIADMSITMDMRKSVDNSMRARKSESVIDIIRDSSTRKSALLLDHSEINPKQELFDKNQTISGVIGKPIPMNLFNIKSAEEKNITKTTERVSLDYSNFKSQDVVVYQVTTNESSKEQKDSSDVDYDSEQGDVKAIQLNDNRNIDLSAVNINESHNEEESQLKDDLRKSIKPSEMSEGRDISKIVSMYDEVGDRSVRSTISKKSLLCDLLDMSHASISSGLADKNVTTDIVIEKPSVQEMPKTDTESVASEMFYITRDTDSETKSNEVKVKNAYPSITFVEEVAKNNASEVLQSESVPETDMSTQNVTTAKDSYEDCANSSNTSGLKKADFDQSNMELSRYPKSFSEVDNTKQLLDMLSDLTDGRRSRSISGGASPLSLTVTGRQNAIENKMADPRRVSIAPMRQSIVLSREDVLNNISMAQAALQQSIEIEYSDDDDSIHPVAVSPQKKPGRVSNEVVKALHFEDESTSEISVKSDQRSPLRKSALGEVSHTNVGKANVIPTYLKDVSDGIKALMSDLVKPVTDEMPFEAVNFGEGLKKSTSTCSTQIQANLYTSSQIDMDTNETCSNSDMFEDKDKNNKISPRSTLKSVSFIGSEVYAHSDLVSKNLKEASFRPKRQPSPIPGKVLVFDHENPLNNVLLTPTEFTEVHKYCPSGGSMDTLGDSEKSHMTQSSLRDNEYDVANVAVPFNIQSYNMASESVTASGISSNNQSANRRSMDQAIGVKVTEVKDVEINTAIVMKKNKELLEASSSLTLVDDALARSTFDVQIDTEAPTESCSNISEMKSPLKVIYKLKHDKDEKKTESDKNVDRTKSKKRIYSPGNSVKSKNSSKLSITPKPNKKIPKLDTSNSKSYSLKRTSGNKSIIDRYSSAESKMEVSPSKENRKKKKKNSHKKEGVSVMVQQLLTEFNVRSDVDQKDLNKQILDALSKTDSSAAPESLSECERSLEAVSSFTSSKNQYKARPSSITTDVESASAESHSEEWSAEQECDASVNVVAKIDMLPFMGSHECEWAPSGTDAWRFQLLHGRLRLRVRLAHRHHNATRSRVRADTPVRDVSVHQAYHANDQRNSVAMSCITFACEAIRAQSSCAVAGAVPALLRRAANVARRALAWGRAMHDARMQLAFTLSGDKLLLKVANIPLRCVWEVSMHLVMTQDESPWPQATQVRVTRVLDARAVTDDTLDAMLRSVPRGWGHVPATVWKLFKYLKNKGPDTEEPCSDIGQGFRTTVCS